MSDFVDRNILHGIVTVKNNGGQRLDTYHKELTAIYKANEIISHIKNNQIKGITVWMSELNYNSYKNRILDSKLINDDSVILYKS